MDIEHNIIEQENIFYNIDIDQNSVLNCSNHEDAEDAETNTILHNIPNIKKIFKHKICLKSLCVIL